MRTIVRLLARLAVLGVAAGALFFVLDRARPADAIDPPIGGDTIPELPAADLPAPAPPPAPSLSPPPAVPLPAVPAPAVPALPALTAVPAVPDGLVPAITAPAPAPPEGAPDAPAPPASPAPTPPQIPGVDVEKITRAVGPLPAVPSVSAPEAELPELPALPDEVPPLQGLLDVVAVTPYAPAPEVALDRAPTVAAPEPARSRAEVFDTGWTIPAFALAHAPARAPPPPPQPPFRSCPGGGTSHTSRADWAGSLPSGTDDATRRAALFADARSYASTLLLDPVLRPD